MRSSLCSVTVVVPFFLAMSVFGQEHKPLQAPRPVNNPQLTISPISSSTNHQTGSQTVRQRMTASQKLIHQRALVRAEQRLRRINDRQLRGVSLSRPTVRTSLFPSNVEIMQPAPTLYYHPSNFYSTWYRP